MWNIARRDVPIPKHCPTQLLAEKHKQFILKCGNDRNSYVSIWQTRRVRSQNWIYRHTSGCTINILVHKVDYLSKLMLSSRSRLVNVKSFVNFCLQEYIMSEYLRMSGLYWCVASLDVLDAIGEADHEFILHFIRTNQNADGGYAAADGHDSHILHTLCAIQVILNHFIAQYLNSILLYFLYFSQFRCWWF